jgi:hypothetical protein
MKTLIAQMRLFWARFRNDNWLPTETEADNRQQNAMVSLCAEAPLCAEAVRRHEREERI